MLAYPTATGLHVPFIFVTMVIVKEQNKMPIEIKVGPPTITTSQGRTFIVTTQSGEIQANTDQGVYAQDTRFVSSYRLYVNRARLSVINSSQLSFYASRFHLTNPQIETESGTILEQTLRITLITGETEVTYFVCASLDTFGRFMGSSATLLIRHVIWIRATLNLYVYA
jgi:hypothetical protein